MFDKLYPEDAHDILTERHLAFNNMARAADTNDTCNEAHKSRRLLNAEVKKNVNDANLNAHDEPGK